jgi:hypothetical protein
MSLNRNEQMTYDYLHAQADEKRHWQDVVRREFARAEGDPHAAATVLERDLWRYYVERAEVVEPFRGEAQRAGLARTSMRNLAELLLRLWAPLPAKSSKPKTLPYA